MRELQRRQAACHAGVEHAVRSAVNWLVFIRAVIHEQLLQASLGYFVNPLLNVLLGMIFLRERLRPNQTLSIDAGPGPEP